MTTFGVTPDDAGIIVALFAPVIGDGAPPLVIIRKSIIPLPSSLAEQIL